MFVAGRVDARAEVLRRAPFAARHAVGVPQVFAAQRAGAVAAEKQSFSIGADARLGVPGAGVDGIAERLGFGPGAVFELRPVQVAIALGAVVVAVASGKNKPGAVGADGFGAFVEVSVDAVERPGKAQEPSGRRVLV